MGPVSVHFIQFCIQWSSIALLYYDYILTLGTEIRYMWGQKFRFSTILYFCCRYSLIANVIYLLTIANKITGNCHSGFIVSNALSVAGRAAVVLVWAARTYAVFGRNIWILLFFGSIGLTIIALDAVGVATTSCKGSSTQPIVGGVLATMMCVFEILSVGFTTFRSIQALNVNGVWWKQKNGFNYLILEQGILYFCLVTALTIASLALNVTIPGGFLQRLLNAYTVPLSGFMTARFLLHIRKWEAKHSAFCLSTDEDETRTATKINFASRSHLHSHGSQLQYSHSESEAQPSAFLDDFGEDPLKRARALPSAGQEDSNAIQKPEA